MILKRLISNTKIDTALVEYTILSTLKGDYPPFTQKSKYLAMWTKNAYHV
jgi:hypothetical protein